ncbi:MAG: carboxypeptidase-like regulatory domain-containing protein, partial [Candidatus Hodarchaeales archaeon]
MKKKISLILTAIMIIQVAGIILNNQALASEPSKINTLDRSEKITAPSTNTWLEGQIFDNDNGSAIIGATVLVYNATTNYADTTNYAGFYNITNIGPNHNYNITVTASGYLTYDYYWYPIYDGFHKLNIYLTPAAPPPPPPTNTWLEGN